MSVMRKVFLSLFFFLSFFNVVATVCTGAFVKTANNGINVVFLEGQGEDENVLAVLSLAAGSIDDKDKHGSAYILAKSILLELRRKIQANELMYGSEVQSSTGYDHSVYYFYGKNSNLKNFIENLSSILSKTSITNVNNRVAKNDARSVAVSSDQSDKSILAREVRSSLYWHSGYGSPIIGYKDAIDDISDSDLNTFHASNYTADRASVIIAGKVDQDKVMEIINGTIGSIKTKSTIERLQEPTHHDSTVKICKHSAQVSSSTIEFYWKVPNYRLLPKEARCIEVFINCIDDILQTKLIKELDLASSISFKHSFWNYQYGDFCIVIVPKSYKNFDQIGIAVLSEIKLLAKEGITKAQLEAAQNKAMDFNKFTNKDFPSTIDWLSKKLAACNDFNFIKGYDSFVKECSVEEVNAEAKKFFSKPPEVISILKPFGGLEEVNSQNISNDKKDETPK